MRKFYAILTGILFTLLFATCKQFTDNIDEYLSYWSTAVSAVDYSINKPSIKNGDTLCVPSAEDVTVTIKLNNPKSLKLLTLTSSTDAEKVIRFPRLSPQPEYGKEKDYTLTQTASNELSLTYKKDFLQAHEWGNADISPEITFIADDGRVFDKQFSMNLKANTPPPKPSFSVVKTKASPAYYVLCIKVPDMDKTVSGKLLHKDLARVEINGTPYTFSVDEAHHTFVRPKDDAFITRSDVEKLNEPKADEVPAGGWVLYYKTDVEVKAGAAKKDYAIKLIDEKGLVSGILNASTKPNKAEAEKVRTTKGTNISGSGSETDPTIIGTDSTGAVLSVSSATANTIVHCTVSEIGGLTPVKYDGNPVTVPLPLNGTGEKKYKLEYYTDGEGFAATPVQTVYYKVVEGHTVTFSVGSGNGTLTGTYGTTVRTASGSAQQTLTVLHGENATFTAQPDTGYEVEKWTVDGNVISGHTSTNYTLSNVTANKTVTVTFKKIPCTITFSVNGGNGTISARPDGGSETSSGSITVEYGRTVTFTATSADATHYKVGDWTCTPSEGFTVASGQSRATLTVTADTTVSVQFVQLNELTIKKLTICGKDARAGSVTLPYTVAQVKRSDITLEFNGHASIPFTVSPQLLNLTEGIPQSITLNVAASPGNYPAWSKTVSITRAKNDVAKLQSFTLNGETKTAASDGSFASEYAVASNKAEVKGFSFADGSTGATASVNLEGNVPIPAGMGKTFTITVKAQDGTIKQTISFTVKRKKYNVNYSVDGVGGKIKIGSGTAVTSDSTKVEYGGSVTFTATSADATHYKVGDWTCTPSEGFTGASGNPTATLTVTADTTVSVQFVQLNALTLSRLEIHGKDARAGSVTLPYTVTQVKKEDISLAFSGQTGIAFTVSPSTLSLTEGESQSITLKVAASPGNYPEWTKTVSITRAKNDKAKLQSFTLNGETKTAASDGSFASEYEVASDKAEVKGFSFAAGSTGATASVTPAGNESIPADTGKTFTITVKAQDGTVKQTIPFTVKRKKYTVTYSVETVDGKAGGTIEAGTSGQTTGGTVLVTHGGSVTFKGRPATGDWKVAGWTGATTIPPYTTEAELSNVTEPKTVTVKFYQSYIKSPATWRDLARAVKSAPDNAVITINGEIQATDVTDDKSEIDVKKNLTIKGENNAVLNALGKQGIFDAYKTLTLQDITLKNSALPSNYSGGAGVYVNSYGTLIMKGSSVITECSAVNWGGGVYVGGGTFEMHDTSAITGCTASKGGGVYVRSGTFKMQDSAIVTPSTSGDTDKPGKNDVYLATGRTITVDGSLSKTRAARITPGSYDMGKQVLSGVPELLKSEHGKFTVTPKDLGGGTTQQWQVGSEGELNPETVAISGSASERWKKLKEAAKHIAEGGTIFIDGEVQATSGTGNNGEIVINKNLTIKRATGASSAVIDANKDTGSKPKHRIFKVESGNTLTLENLTLKGGIAEISDMDGSGGGVYVKTSGKLIMTGSSITDCEAIGDTSKQKYGEGGGVYNKGTVKMTGGEIKNNKARNGGGIDNNGTLILTNATLTGNTATFVGGALCMSSDSSSEMTGGKIISNTCSGSGDGGGVYIHAGTFTLKSGASIESNTADYGGGAYVGQNGTLIINGGSIKLNKAQSRGGGVYVSGNSTKRGTLRMIQGDISDNGAGWNGASYTRTGGGVYNNGVFEMTGGEIKDNKAGTGGGVYFSEGTFKMSGSAVVTPATGSEANDKGKNDVYLTSGQAITVDGTLSNNPAARITPESYTVTQVLDGNITTGSPQNYTKFTVTSKVIADGIAEVWEIKSNGDLEKSKYMDIRYDKLAYYLSSTYASSYAVEGINYIKITGTIPPEDLRSKYFERMGKLAQTIQNSHKNVALILPDRIPGLGGMYQCFYECEYLVSLENIPLGVTGIPECFKGCKNLTKAPVIPDSVDNMEECFQSCEALKEAPAIPSGVTAIKSCFNGCKELTKAPVLPSGVTDIYACFAGCEKLTKAPAIPSGVTNIEHCFQGCKALTQGPDIPSSVYNMYQCFQGCTSLQELKLMCNYDGQFTLFKEVFDGCSKLNNGGIKVPQNQLQAYQDGAGHMKTTREKFSGF